MPGFLPGEVFDRRRVPLAMRTVAFAVLAFVASGCTIHVVETATPITVAEAPPPVPVYVARPRPVVYQRITPSPRPSLAPRPNPRVVERTEPTTPAVQPLRRPPAKLIARERRPTHLVDLSPHRHRGPMKVKLPEPATGLSSASVAKAQ